MKGASAEVAILNFLYLGGSLCSPSKISSSTEPPSTFLTDLPKSWQFLSSKSYYFCFCAKFGSYPYQLCRFWVVGVKISKEWTSASALFSMHRNPFEAALTHSALSSSASKASWQSGVTTSDHKPVWGMFEVRVKPGKDSVPLAGGLFNRWCLVFLIFNKIFSRAVYLEGLKRRSESLKPHLGRGHTAANICNVSWWW